MKKFIALVMVGVMALGMSSMAAGSPSAAAVKAQVSAPAASTTVASPATAEEVNNVVTKTPGIENAEVVGIPQGLLVDGVKINYTIKIAKVTKAEATSALSLGKVLNVFKVKNNQFKNAQVAIWCPAIKAGQKVSAYQCVDGQWKKLVSSVRAEHIDVVLAGNGLVAIVTE